LFQTIAFFFLLYFSSFRASANLFGKSSDGFTVRIAHDVGEAAALTEVGFEYVTGEYNDGGKIFRKRK
jgi:hypothetical protein